MQFALFCSCLPRWLFRRAVVCALVCSVCLSGCAGFTSKPDWLSRISGDKKKTAYITPAKKLEQLRDVESRVAELPEPEQNRISAELVRGFEVEKDAILRTQIVRTLGQLKTPAALQIVEQTLQDSDSEMRITACEAIAKQQNPAAARLLAETLGGDTDQDVRLAAARALGKVKGPEVVPALALALEDKDPAMQYRAVESFKENTGLPLGDDVNAWRQYAETGRLPQREESVVGRLFPWVK